MDDSRRAVLRLAAFGALTAVVGRNAAWAAGSGMSAIEANDRVFIANEDSNTISVIDPRTNTVETNQSHQLR